MRKFFLVFLSVVFFICSQDSFGQINRKSVKKNNKRMSSYKGKKSGFPKEKRYNCVGFAVNALNYYGDLAPRPGIGSTDISFTRPGFSGSFSHRFGPRYTLSTGLMWGTLRGSDAESADRGDLDNGVFRYRRNLSFRNQIKELSVVGVFDLFPNNGSYMSRVAWTPYAFIGLAVFHHNPRGLAPATDLSGNRLSEAGQWVQLRPLGTEGQYATLDPTDLNAGIKPYSTISFAIPFGLGARLRLNEVMDISADIAFRYTFTDYLDDVSQNYVDLGVLSSPLAKAMSYRGNELPAEDRPTSTSYIGRDGISYTVITGYGQEQFYNMRGSKKDRDIYMVTSIRISYIIGATMHRAKFR